MNLGPAAAHLSLVRKTMQIDEADRRTPEEYASEEENEMTLEEVQRVFGATGKLDCPGNSKGSANLTVANNVITTAAHNFLDIKTCEKLFDPSQCTFTVGTGETAQVIPILNAEYGQIGAKCPGPIDEKDDWAVLKLKVPAAGVTPYRLPSNKEWPVKSIDKIVAVASRSHDFVRNGQYPKSIGNCSWGNKQLRNSGSLGYIYTNCDAGKGASGGAILLRKPGRVFELVGVVNSVTENEEQIIKERASGKPIRGKYSPAWNSSAVVLTDDFYKAVENAVGTAPK